MAYRLKARLFYEKHQYEIGDICDAEHAAVFGDDVEVVDDPKPAAPAKDEAGDDGKNAVEKRETKPAKNVSKK